MTESNLTLKTITKCQPTCLVYYPIFIMRYSQDQRCIGGTIILHEKGYHTGCIALGMYSIGVSSTFDNCGYKLG